MSATPALPATMKAIVFTGSGRAELRDWTLQEPPLRDDEIAGRALVTLTSPGTELNAFVAPREQPALSGYAAVMEVDTVGAAVTDARAGDRFFVMGPHASRQRKSRSCAVRVPDGLPAEAAVFCRLLGVSWTTLVTTTATTRPA